MGSGRCLGTHVEVRLRQPGTLGRGAGRCYLYRVLVPAGGRAASSALSRFASTWSVYDGSGVAVDPDPSTNGLALALAVSDGYAWLASGSADGAFVSLPAIT